MKSIAYLLNIGNRKKNKVKTKEIIKMETNYIKNIKTIEKTNQKLILRKGQ